MPVEGSDEEKRTNEIGMAIPLLETCDIAGKDVTGDAILTQRAIATYVVQNGGYYHFTVKGNQPTLESDIELAFKDRGSPDYTEVSPPDHGRIETRRIWCSTELNDYLDFPGVGQVFLIERESLDKKSGERSLDVAMGITARTPQQASPRRVLQVNRGHWAIESVHYIIDWNYDETAAASEPAMARRTSPDFAVSLSASKRRSVETCGSAPGTNCWRT